MPDIPLLNPVVLRGVVEKFDAPESLILLNKVPKSSHPFPGRKGHPHWPTAISSATSPFTPSHQALVRNRLCSSAWLHGE